MRTPVKIGLVAAGYVGAFLLASAVVAVHVTFTSGPDAQASSGMFAFGDALLFLAVFAVAAVPPTGALLFVLRPYRGFWRALSVTALAIATTGLAASAIFLASPSAGPGSALHAWSAAAVLRILAAPPFALAFLLAGLLAPDRSLRIALLGAALLDAVAFTPVALLWIRAILSSLLPA